MARLSLAAATIALCGMTACSGDDDNTSDQPVVQPGVPEGYTVCIHATMDDGDTRAVSFDADGVTCTSTLSAEDRVYVYNRGGGGHSAGMLKGYLTPTNISANGKSCDLVGTIQGGFYMSNKLILANLAACRVCPARGRRWQVHKGRFLLCTLMPVSLVI